MTELKTNVSLSNFPSQTFRNGLVQILKSYQSQDKKKMNNLKEY